MQLSIHATGQRRTQPFTMLCFQQELKFSAGSRANFRAQMRYTQHSINRCLMKTTVDYMLALQKTLDLGTPYAIAKYLGIAPSSVYRYLAGEQKMDDYTALKVAKALGLDPMEVIAATNAERAKTEAVCNEWTALVKKVGGKAAAVVLILSAVTLPQVIDIKVVQASALQDNVGIMRNVRQRRNHNKVPPHEELNRASATRLSGQFDHSSRASAARPSQHGRGRGAARSSRAQRRKMTAAARVSMIFIHANGAPSAKRNEAGFSCCRAENRCGC